MTLTEVPTLFETASLMVFGLGLMALPFWVRTLTRAAREGVEDALTPRHKHGKIKA